MGYNSWDAVLTVKGLVVDIHVLDDDDEHYGKECLRRSSSEPNLQKSVHLPISPVQICITVDPCSHSLAETVFNGAASSKRKDSEHDASLVAFGEWTSEEYCFSQDSFNVEGVEIKEYNESVAFKDPDEDGIHGNGIAHGAISTKTRRRTHKQRPCKGQRIRYQKLEARLMSEISERPAVFDIDGIVWPPSFSDDSEISSRRKALVSKLRAYKDKVLREREIESILQPLLRDSDQTGDASMAYSAYSSMATRATMPSYLETVPTNNAQESCLMCSSNMTYGMDYSMVPLR